MTLARWFVLLLALAVLPLWSATAQDRVGLNLPPTLEVEGPVAPGGGTTLALRFTPVSDEWHGYWSNPGDAGLGMEVEWDLPDGVTIGEFQYPTPSRLMIDGLMNHVFKGEYAVLVPLRLSAEASVRGPLRIAGTAFYLACTDEICVPEEARIETLVPIGSRGADNPRFVEWRAAIPPMLDSTARFEQAGGLLRLAIPLPANVEVGQPHVFLSEKDVVAYGPPQGFRRVGDLLIAEIELAGTGERPQLLTGILKLGGEGEDARGLQFTAEQGDVPSGGDLIMARGESLPETWAILLGALAGGLLLNIMPCVFPILSLKALSLASAGEGEAQARADALAYTAGVVLACVALGGLMLALRAAGEQVGWAFQLQEPGVVVALFVLCWAIAANFAGVFELPSLPITTSGKPGGAFATGLLAAVAATPCSGPFMAAAIGAALLLPTATALAIFAALGLGLALPFLLLGFVPALRSRLPRPGSWMVRFRRILALPMALTGVALGWLLAQFGGGGLVLLASVAALTLVGLFYLLHSRGLPVFAWLVALAAVIGVSAVRAGEFAERHEAQVTQSILEPQAFSRDALAEARASDRAVFVWFTADWCVTCKVNERVAIERADVRQAFSEKGVVAMVGDWTQRDAEIAKFLTEQGVAGVPLYLWYPPGATTPERLPQVLAPSTLTDLARALPSRSTGRNDMR